LQNGLQPLYAALAMTRVDFFTAVISIMSPKPKKSVKFSTQPHKTRNPRLLKNDPSNEFLQLFRFSQI